MKTPPRMRGGVYMTLLAAFRARNGFVVAADTQETSDYYDEQGRLAASLRSPVQKLNPQQVGNYVYAIVGAGHARLIDAFIERARRAVESDTEQPSAAILRGVLETSLEAFYRNDVAICPDANKEFALFIPFFCAATREHGVWVSTQHLLRDLQADHPELLGDEYELYKTTANKMFHSDMSLSQAVLAAIDILTLGEETSNYVKGPFHVAIIRENGIWMERPDYIAMMSDRLRSFESGINQLFLACADAEISPQQFENVMTAFGEEAASLHKQHLDAAVQRMLAVGLNRINDPYSKIPLGTVIRTLPGGAFEANYDVNARRIMGDIVRAQHGTVPPPLEDEK